MIDTRQTWMNYSVKSPEKMKTILSFTVLADSTPARSQLFPLSDLVFQGARESRQLMEIYLITNIVIFVRIL